MSSNGFEYECPPASVMGLRPNSESQSTRQKDLLVVEPASGYVKSVYVRNPPLQPAVLFPTNAFSCSVLGMLAAATSHLNANCLKLSSDVSILSAQKL